MEVKESLLVFAAEGVIFPLAVVDVIKLDNLGKRCKECDVHYDQGRVVGTSQKNGLVLTQ